MADSDFGAANPPSFFESLPAEIMFAIFEIGSDLPPSAAHEIPFHLTVSQVARRWRMIALDTACLWTSVIITPKMPRDYLLGYLERSRLHALDVRINFRNIKEWQLPEVPGIFACITPHSLRWNRLSLTSSSSGAIEVALLMLGLVSTPRLQSLHIAQIGEPESCFYTSYKALKNGPPALTSLRLDGITLDIHLFRIAAITSLHVEDYRVYRRSLSSSAVFDILREMPVLRHLVLLGPLFTFWSLPQTMPHILPSLRFLRISDPQFSLPFLEAISAPLLESLVLEYVSITCVSEFTYPNPDGYLSVRSLTLINSFLDTISYTKICRLFRNTTHLALVDSETDPALVILRPMFFPLLSNLQKLSLSSASFNLLCSVVKDRSMKGQCPPPNLCLGDGIISDLRDAGRLQWLEEHVNVEVLQEDLMLSLPWPPNVND